LDKRGLEILLKLKSKIIR